MSASSVAAASLADVLQIGGWLLTVLGQVQVARKARRGFITWIAANAVLIALSIHVELWWSIGMYATNVGVCLWSFRRWGEKPQEEIGAFKGLSRK